MPDKPTLQDFFKYRFAAGPTQHLLQSANLAQKNGLEEKMVLGCLLHDIAVCGFIRADHGYWGAQLIEPYVDEEVSWAIRNHQALRFYPDESVGYPYPDNYVRMFGADYVPAPYIQAEYERAKETQMVYVGAHDLRERSVFLRSQRQGDDGSVRRHHRPPFQAAQGRARQRQYRVVAYVAHHHPALQRTLVFG